MGPADGGDEIVERSGENRIFRKRSKSLSGMVVTDRIMHYAIIAKLTADW